MNTNNDMIMQNARKSTPDDRTNDGYHVFLNSIQCVFDSYSDHPGTSGEGNLRLFRVNRFDLFDIFLEYLPEEARQHYNCNTCRSFVRRYGNLVTITYDGEVKSVLWNEDLVPEFFVNSVRAMRKAVEAATVYGSFFTNEDRLGVSSNTDGDNEWYHISVKTNLSRNNGIKCFGFYGSLNEKMGSVNEDMKTLLNAIRTYKEATITNAVNMIKSRTLLRPEKVEANALWLLRVHQRYSRHSYRRNAINIMWREAAMAPTGFCHIKSSMLGALLDDIAAGLDNETIRNKFNDKMDPLRYKRPQAAPTVGNIKRAEEIIAKMGLEKSLERRFAKVEELPGSIWCPTPIATTVEEKPGGVFSHLVPKGETISNSGHDITVPIKMTWVKFARDVLPDAKLIEYCTPDGGMGSLYGAVVTAVHEDAPPIIVWDKEDSRVPFSWYFYNGSCYNSDWNLSSGSRVVVTGIFVKPNQINGGSNYPDGVILTLNDAKDMKYTRQSSGNALFPEMLKSELREIRSTIEAYSRSAVLSGAEDATACGLILDNHAAPADDWNVKLRVTTEFGVSTYIIDRYE